MGADLVWGEKDRLADDRDRITQLFRESQAHAALLLERALAAEAQAQMLLLQMEAARVLLREALAGDPELIRRYLDWLATNFPDRYGHADANPG